MCLIYLFYLRNYYASSYFCRNHFFSFTETASDYSIVLDANLLQSKALDMPFVCACVCFGWGGMFCTPKVLQYDSYIDYCVLKPSY